MTVSKESREFFKKLSKLWQNFKDYSYLDGINLSPEQISIIEQDEDQLLIEGYAGTGKSLTLLYKFIDILVREEGKKILFVTYNSTLIEDTKKRLRTSREYCENKDRHEAHVMTFHEMATNILKQVKVIECGVGRLNVEKIKKHEGNAFTRIAGIYAKYNEKYSNEYRQLPKEERLYTTHDIKFVTEEIAWLKAMGFTQIDKYLTTERTGRNKSIRLTRAQRKTIFKIYELYQKEMEGFKYGERLDLEDYALRIVQNEHLFNDNIKYDYIFVDEQQDLDPMQIMALCRLTKKSIVLSGDVKQRIYKKCPVKYEDLGLMLRQKGRRKVLNKNYRSTAQIVRLANSLKFYDLGDKLVEKMFVKEGSKPIIHSTNDNSVALRYIARQIKDIHEKDPKKSIAIIHREEIKSKTGYKSDTRIKLEQLLLQQKFTDINSYGKKFDFKNDKQVFYTNAYDVKGLEFDAVFIIDFNSMYYPDIRGIKKIKESNEGKDESLISEDILEFINTEKKLLYVAMTRAKEELFLISNTQGGKLRISEFIYDFDSKDYKESGFIKKDIEKNRQHYNFVGNGKLFRRKEKEKQEKIQAEITKKMEAVVGSKGAEIVKDSIEEIKENAEEIKIINKDIINVKMYSTNIKQSKPVEVNTQTEHVNRNEDLVETVVKPLLIKHKIKFIDNRVKNGSLWIVGGVEIKGIIDTFAGYGLRFFFARNGGRATNRMPSWYLK